MSFDLSIVELDQQEARAAAADADDYYTDRPTRRELLAEEQDCRD